MKKIMRYIIKKKELPDTVKIGSGTRYFRNAEIANAHLNMLIQHDKKTYKKYDVYFTVK